MKHGADPRYVCPACWKVLADGGALACPECAGAPPAAGWPSMPCSFRGRFLLTEPIGRDAASALFHAQSGAGGEPIVLVEIARPGGLLTAAVTRRVTRRLFRREATLAGLLGEASDAFFALSSIDVTDPAYIAFEHVPWPALGDVLAEAGALPSLAAARVGVAILRGLGALEEHGLVHRALAPSRIFVHRNHDGGYDVKIAGFGVWPDAGEVDAIGPSPDVVPYASPEQLRGELLTAASDVYMVASILWELVTGQVLHPVPEGTPKEEAARARLRELGRVPARPAAMPRELYDALARALHPEARERCREGSPVATLHRELERFCADFPRRQERELAGALRELGATARSLATLHARLSPVRAILDREAELGATVQRLAQDPADPEAVRAGARAAEDALVELDADVERLLSPEHTLPSRIAPQASASDPPPRSPPSPLPASIPPSFPPASRHDPADSSPPETPSKPVGSTSPRGASLAPDPLDRYDIPGVGGRRWPYALGALGVAALAIGGVRLATGSSEAPSPSASASALAAPASFGATSAVSTALEPLPSASAPAPPDAGSAPSASAAPPRPKRAPPRKRSPDEEPTEESPPEPH